jgi:deoxycytidylate deaminase
MSYHTAFSKSDDPRTKNGSVFVQGHQRFRGANRLPEGVHRAVLDNPEEKYKHIIHAEVDGIDQTLAAGVTAEGGILVCQWYACKSCAEYIADHKVAQCVGHIDPYHRTVERWQKEIVTGFNILHKAGVKTSIYTGRVGGVQAMIRGEIWRP